MVSEKTPKLHRVVNADGSLHGYHFQCPACQTLHTVGVGWTFNGDMVRPEFSPSIDVTWDHLRLAGKRCHSFIRDGQISFEADSTHKLAGQTVPLGDLPDWLVD